MFFCAYAPVVFINTSHYVAKSNLFLTTDFGF